MSRPPSRPIKRLLVANRGEIATRIISSARELDIETFAIYVLEDDAHTVSAAHALELESTTSFMNIDSLIDIVKKNQIDAVHPGYGFLSESEDFAKRMWEQADAVVVGPGWGILSNTGDKLKARQLAEDCHVPVCPALRQPTDNIDHVRGFASEIGYPLMVKAVDGGGGRGIRLVRNENQLAPSITRAIEESPSKLIFAEKAAIDGFRHIEVQILGDGTGDVTHLWERECSIQRRYQKIVEIAPSRISNRHLIAKVINDALQMARYVKYFSLGTFEFLVNPHTCEYFFLEVNPRLQVEHTITESISMTDIVRTQLLLSQGATLDDCGIPKMKCDPEVPPSVHSVQLRITAENVQNDWSLSIGKITSFQFPAGNGVRVDTHLTSNRSTIVSADFDSLIAKVIVTASSWEGAVRKARRALDDTCIVGVKTNISMLRAIVSHRDFLVGDCDTRWLESNNPNLLQSSQRLEASLGSTVSSTEPISILRGISAANTLLRKGDAWSIEISLGQDSTPTAAHLELTRVLRNDFPRSLAIETVFTTSSKSTPYVLNLTSTSSSAQALTSSSHRRVDPANASHIAIPFAGKLVDVLVDEGDDVKEGDVLCVVQQMKMELEVRSPRSGTCSWVVEAEEGEDVGEGWLLCIIEREGGRL